MVKLVKNYNPSIMMVFYWSSILQFINGLLTPTSLCAPQFFWRHARTGKSDITTFSVAWPPLKWSTVRGFILTQVDKFAPRKYLSSLKLVFASDTRFTHFVLFFYSAQDFCQRTLNKSGLCLSHYDLNKTKQGSEIWNNFIEDHLTVGCLGRSENKII